MPPPHGRSCRGTGRRFPAPSRYTTTTRPNGDGRMSGVSRWRDSGPWNVPSRPPTASRPSTPPSPRCWTTPAAASRRDAQAARLDPGNAGRPELYLFRSLMNAVPGHVRSTFARQSGPSRAVRSVRPAPSPSAPTPAASPAAAATPTRRGCTAPTPSGPARSAAGPSPGGSPPSSSPPGSPCSTTPGNCATCSPSCSSSPSRSSRTAPPATLTNNAKRCGHVPLNL
jgi:hypothetical protein